MGSETQKFVLKIRASSAGKLMGKLEGLTDKQAETLKSYQARKDGTGKPLTKLQADELARLIAKRDAPPELPQTAKSYIEELWRKIKFGYSEPVVTDELLKGDMCEQEGIDMVSLLLPGEFRVKNKITFDEDPYFIGTPDILLEQEPDVVEDIKSVWSLKTFMDKTDIEPIYYGQGQVYLHLTSRKKFRVHYCLFNTPKELVEREQRHFFWKFGGDETNKQYLEICEQIARNHDVEKIPLHKRLKTFEFDYDPCYIAELQKRVEIARVYFDSLKL